MNAIVTLVEPETSKTSTPESSLPRTTMPGCGIRWPLIGSSSCRLLGSPLNDAKHARGSREALDLIKATGC